MILLGMMADATDECSAMQVESLSVQVTSSKDRVDALFTKGLCLETGFTKVALEHLANP